MRRWSRRVCRGIAFANVWACGVNSALHDWNAAIGGLILALILWVIADLLQQPDA